MKWKVRQNVKSQSNIKLSIKNAGIYPENNVVLESMIICEFETKQ